MKLELFHKMECPYSAKVRAHIEARGLRSQTPFHDISAEPGAAERLESIGGKKQVPCLVRDGEAIYESDTIVAALDELSEAHPISITPEGATS